MIGTRQTLPWIPEPSGQQEVRRRRVATCGSASCASRCPGELVPPTTLLRARNSVCAWRRYADRLPSGQRDPTGKQGRTYLFMGVTGREVFARPKCSTETAAALARRRPSGSDSRRVGRAFDEFCAVQDGCSALAALMGRIGCPFFDNRPGRGIDGNDQQGRNAAFVAELMDPRHRHPMRLWNRESYWHVTPRPLGSGQSQGQASAAVKIMQVQTRRSCASARTGSFSLSGDTARATAGFDLRFRCTPREGCRGLQGLTEGPWAQSPCAITPAPLLRAGMGIGLCAGIP